MSDLLPCSFCGGQPKHLSGGFGFGESVCCACGCDFDGTPEQWNRRATPAASSEDVRAGALREEIAIALKVAEAEGYPSGARDVATELQELLAKGPRT